MNPSIKIAFALGLLTTPVMAVETPATYARQPAAATEQQPQQARPGQSAPDPTQQALAQMIGEAQSREAQALVQVYTLRTQVAAEKKRADDAEAKLKSADKP
jgi:hypothetical protein